MNKKVFFAVMVGLLCSRGVFAEDTLPSYTTDEVVVSATKTLNSISDAGGSSVTVITAEDIANSGKETVAEVIKGVPGIDIASSGGIGSTTSIFMRGADSKNVLLLIDGVPTNDPSDGNRAASIANLTVDNIERIEVVRGPLSSLYGASASAGVINIITKRGGVESSVYGGVEGGSFGTNKFYGGATGMKGLFDYAVNVSRYRTDGFSTVDERNRCINPGNAEYEDDSYENTTWSGNFGLKLSSVASLRTVLRYTDAALDYDASNADSSVNSSDTKSFNGRIALTLDTKPLFSTFSYDFNSIDRDNTSGTTVSRYHGYLYDLGWQGDIAATANNTVTVGLNYQNESLDNNADGTAMDKSVDTKSAFLQDQWHIGGFDLVGAVRFEDHETFGNKTTWRVAPSYALGNTKLKFSYGTGYTAPSLYQLYSTDDWGGGPVGNDQLKPETSRGWDAGFEQKIVDNLKFGATYFRTDYDDRIDYDSATFRYVQVSGKTKTSGVESFVEWNPLKQLFLAGNYTYTYTRNPLGEELARRPKNKAGLTASWEATDKVKLNTSMQWVGSRIDSEAKDENCITTNKLESYFLANLSASFQVHENVELYGRVDNLFDEYYEEVWSYATPGRSAYAGMKLTF
ncbi:TonB-dependent receptor plug domain-containing protein [Chlorobium phaeovibrioides]|uniref:TonB-dependent receptor plug domain-containing protein n=1 Tax=Chlorobium phaeovibrioides TaxID=1094 RepID=UPI0012310D4C|nr:TonB-dependent receptor [Chlorobium phaeovibrioides]QEQ57070.1 TonB-dependent receptor [Chlorobium phaeovibrioides]